MVQWRLTSRGEKIFDHWTNSDGATAERRDLLVEVLTAVADDAFRARWWTKPRPDVEGVTEIRAGGGLVLLASKVSGGAAGVVWVDLVSVTVVENDEADL